MALQSIFFGDFDALHGLADRVFMTSVLSVIPSALRKQLTNA
jgi:hypothetical protein